MIQISQPATRESFRFSRALEYLTETELTKQIGYRREQWPLVVAKELIDNSLDNCEEIGVRPKIAVEVTSMSITVTDNGSGIEPSTIEGMLDFDVRQSSREVYRSLTRGAQGNAAKCILAIPYILADGHPENVAIEARRVRHVVRVAVNQLAQKPEIQYRTESSEVQIGTSVTVPFALRTRR